MSKVGIYIRVSTAEQANEGYSIEGQRDKLTSYCDIREWSIHDYYIDGGFTGTNMDRPELRRLLSDIKEEKLDTVLVYKLDRLSRKQGDIIHLVEEIFIPNNINFVSILENFDTSTPFGRAMIGILAVFAQLERDSIVERTKMGKERRAKSGKYSGGPAPIGYRVENGRLIIDEYEALQVKEVFTLYKDHGQNKTASIMNDKGYKTKYGKWHGKTVARVVENPIYLGKIRHKSDVYDGDHDAIVSEDEYNTLQKSMDKRSYIPRERSQNIFSGLLWCSYCGARMKPTWTTPQKGDRQYRYYVCYSVAKHPRHMVKDPDCPGSYWRMEDIDKQIFDVLNTVILDKNKFLNAYKDLFGDNNSIHSKINILKKKIAQNDNQLSKLFDLYQSDKIPKDRLENRVIKLQDENKSLKKEITNITTIENFEETQFTPEELLQGLENFNDLWDAATSEEKRALALSMIERIEVGDQIDISFKDF